MNIGIKLISLFFSFQFGQVTKNVPQFVDYCRAYDTIFHLESPCSVDKEIRGGRVVVSGRK